ncbi:MAG TPA: serine hydrolase, partial [Actinomycetota bacterium]
MAPVKIARIVFRTLVALALLLGCAGVAFADPATAPADPAPAVPPPPHLGMAAGILVDTASGKVLWSHDADVARPPASLTKILTALVVLDRANLDDNVTVTPEARGVDGARIYVEAGWVMPVRDLLWGLLLESGNDAAVALAQKVSPDGTVWGFAKLMNERARELGAVHSTFVNPHGLDAPGHVATPRDLAIIATAAMRNPTFAEMVSTIRHSIAWGDGSTRELTNHNKLLERYPGTIGVKTGFT